MLAVGAYLIAVLRLSNKPAHYEGQSQGTGGVVACSWSMLFYFDWHDGAEPLKRVSFRAGKTLHPMLQGQNFLLQELSPGCYYSEQNYPQYWIAYTEASYKSGDDIDTNRELHVT